LRRRWVRAISNEMATSNDSEIAENKDLGAISSEMAISNVSEIAENKDLRAVDLIQSDRKPL